MARRARPSIAAVRDGGALCVTGAGRSPAWLSVAAR